MRRAHQAIVLSLLAITLLAVPASGADTGFGTSNVSSGSGEAVAVLAANVTGGGQTDLVVAVAQDGGLSPVEIDVYTGPVDSGEAPAFTLTASETGSNVRLAAGDLDGDGSADLAVAHVGKQTLDLFLTGGGALSAATAAPVDRPIRDVAIADMNGDGLPDLVSSVGSVGGPFDFEVEAQQGDGTLAAAQTIASDGSAPIRIADVTRDNLNDLVPGGSHGSSIKVWEQSDVDHSFSSATYSTPASTDDVLLFDVNHDGNEDLVFWNATSDQLWWARSTGAGPNFDPTPPNVSFPPGISTFASGDLNDDAWVDLAGFVGGSATMHVYLQPGSGGFSERCTFPADPLSDAQRVSIADITGDGLQDIAQGVTGSTTGRVRILPQLPAPISMSTSTTISSNLATVKAFRRVTLSGTLQNDRGGCIRNDSVAIMRAKGTGAPVPIGTATLASDGSFSFEDRPEAGTYHYSAAWSGDETHAASAPNAVADVKVDKRPTSLALATSKHATSFGRAVTLTAKVKGGEGTRVVKFLSTVGAKTKRVGTAEANANGLATLRIRPARSATYQAKYGGSANYASSLSDRERVRVRAKVEGKMVSFRTKISGVAIYDCCRAYYKVAVKPNQGGEPIKVTVQYRAGKRWASLGAQGFTLKRDSTRRVYIDIQNGVGYSFRVHACFEGNPLNTGSCAPWVPFRYR
jgi:hypothetical protein